MRIIAALLVAFGVVFGGQAGFAQSPPPVPGQGEVVKVDQSAKKITIKHGPMPKLGMDMPMTMVYAAPDPNMLTAMKPGDRIDFEVQQMNGQYTLTKIGRTK